MTGHVPVLINEVLAAAVPKQGETVVDGTFGAGGYSARFLEAGAKVIAFDRDPTAIAGGNELVDRADGRLTLVQSAFDRLENELEALGAVPVDVVVFDFGVSSMQIDIAQRGFSFRMDGPLDMRMGEGRPVADFINSADEADIADVIYQYGEERKSRRLAKAIVEARRERPLSTTAELAAIGERVVGGHGPIHPATRMFQGLRIFINDELGQIVRALIAAEKVLGAGGRLIAVSFHSLEDRIVKRFLQDVSGRGEATSRHMPVTAAEEPTFDIMGKAGSPSEAEVAANPRSRSSRLRAARRTAAAARPWTDQRLRGLGVPSLVFSDLQRQWAA